MKSLKIALAALVLASPAAVLADPPVMTHTKTMHTERTVTTNGAAMPGHDMHAGDMRHDAMKNAPMRPGEVRHTKVTRVTHRGWTQGRHHGWKNRCHYSMRNGHRVHTCMKTRW